jgi:hypothetical protein
MVACNDMQHLEQWVEVSYLKSTPPDDAEQPQEWGT